MDADLLDERLQLLRMRSRSTLLRCAACAALCAALKTALSFVAPAGNVSKAVCRLQFVLPKLFGFASKIFKGQMTTTIYGKQSLDVYLV